MKNLWIKSVEDRSVNAIETLKSAAAGSVYELPHRFAELEQAALQLLAQASARTTAGDVVAGVFAVPPALTGDRDRRRVLLRFFAQLPAETLASDIRGALAQDWDEETAEVPVSDRIAELGARARRGGFALSDAEAVEYADQLTALAEEARRSEATMRALEGELIAQSGLLGSADVVRITDFIREVRA